MHSVAFLESVLRAHKLDHTVAPSDRAVLPEPGSETGIPSLDARLKGGLPRGQLSQIVGPRSSGRTTLMAAVLASATGRGEVVALVDALDTFDPASGAAAGIDLSHLLWIRGRACGPREMHAHVERAVKAMGLVLNAGNFGCAVLDLADVPTGAVRRLPFTTWLRLGRALEGTRTVGLVVGSDPIARSAGGRTIALRSIDTVGRWTGASDRDRLFQGFDLEARVITKASNADQTGVRLQLVVPDVFSQCAWGHTPTRAAPRGITWFGRGPTPARAAGADSSFRAFGAPPPNADAPRLRASHRLKAAVAAAAGAVPSP